MATVPHSHLKLSLSDLLWSCLGQLDNLTKSFGLSDTKHCHLGWGDSLENTLRRMDQLRSSAEVKNGDLPEIHWEGEWKEVSAVQALELRDFLSAKSLFFIMVDVVKYIIFGRDHPIQYKTLLIRDAWFASPFSDLLPQGCERAHFRIVVPKTPQHSSQPVHGLDWSGKMVINFAATGDQGYTLRQRWYAHPLAAQHGVASLLPVQSYYGKRKPTALAASQSHRSVQQGVAMGFASVEEGCALLRWLLGEKDFGGVGLQGKVCASGVSLGGCVAVMLSGVSRQPIATAPLMATFSPGAAWKADGGVLGKVVAWDVLSCVRPSLSAARWEKVLPGSQLTDEFTVQEASAVLERVLNEGGCPALNPPVVLPQCIVAVSALNDGYMPLDEGAKLQRHFGPSSQWRTVGGGHVTGFLLQHRNFRDAMLSSLHRLEQHSSGDGTNDEAKSTKVKVVCDGDKTQAMLLHAGQG